MDLLAWHRETFTKKHKVTLVQSRWTTPFHPGTFPKNPDGTPLEDREVALPTARSVICQRVVNGFSPEEWAHAQAAFDASDEGEALADQDPGVRREHCEVWLLHRLYEADHPELVPASEMALVRVMAHHASTEKMHAHKRRLVAHVKDGVHLAPPAPKAGTPEVKS